MDTKIANKYELRIENWKNKAIERGAELRSLRKRLKEMEDSRDLNRANWRKERLLRESAISEVQALNKSLHKLKYHSYDLNSVAICLEIKRSGNVSLRSWRSMLLTMCLVFEINFKVPCINTLRNWEQKTGYYRLKKEGDSNANYAIIIDESFSIGRQSLLLVLGINLNEYHFDSSLRMSDIEVLAVEVKSSWKADDISAVITKIRERGYKLVYCCSDGGSNIVKSMIDSDLPRIYDCTHALSLLLKKEYEEQEMFKNFLKAYALLNRKNYMGQDSLICPPKLRGKSRFLNIYPIADWAESSLELVDSLSKKKRTVAEKRVYKKLLWLNKYRGLIAELIAISKLLKAVFKILKNEGLNEASIKATQEVVSHSQAPLFIRVGIRNYLEAQQVLLTDYATMICCSDIIESYFGKFKYNQTKNPSKRITIGCLDIVNYGKKIERTELKKAMESTKIVDLKKWQEKNKLKSFNNRRKELAKKWG